MRLDGSVDLGNLEMVLAMAMAMAMVLERNAAARSAQHAQASAEEIVLNVRLAEDKKELRLTLAGALRVEANAVQTAASLSDGLALLTHSSVDRVLLDLGLPDGDGESLLAALRRKHGTPVLVISAREQHLIPPSSSCSPAWCAAPDRG